MSSPSSPSPARARLFFLACVVTLCACDFMGPSGPPETTPAPDGPAEEAMEAPFLAPRGGELVVRDQRDPVVSYSVQDASRPAPRDPARQAAQELERTPEQELLLRSARNSFVLGNADEALELFDSYLLQVPYDTAIASEYAGLLVQRGELSRARALFEDAVRINPRDADIRRALANVLIISGEYSAAVVQLEAVLELEPDDLDSSTMLCRVYTWLSDYQNAQDVFDRFLRRLDPSIEEDQALLAPVLLDLQRPEEALPHLERLHRRYPQELRWSIHMVLCYHLLGDGERAAQQAEKMAALEPDVVDLRARLAEQLLQLHKYKLAMRVIEQVLRAAPDDAMARLTAARIYIEAYDVGRAQTALDELQGKLGTMRRYQLARAKLQQLSGEWVAAQSTLELLLLKDASDHEARIRLANLHREKGDVYRAKAELRKVPEDSPLGPRARLEYSGVLISMGRAEEAVSICASLADRRPNDVAVASALIRAQLEMGATTQAKYYCQRFIETHPADTAAIGQIRILQAKALLTEGNAHQAARLYELAIQDPLVQSPEAYYGLSIARARGRNPKSSEMALMSSTVSDSGEDIRLRIELGKLALGEQDYRSALVYFAGVLRWQTDNVAALVLLGEAQSLALKDGEKVNPERTFATVLARNPENTRARLGLARCFVIRREFAEAISEYEGIVAQDATYAFAQREYARALNWDRRYEESYAVYDELLAGLPTNAFPVDVFGLGEPGAGLGAELDFEAELELSEVIQLELEAKLNADWRPELAIRALEKLVVIEPANQEARFDLAQLQHRRGRTSSAIEEYEQLIEVSGGHSEASEALAGARREIAPQVNITTGSEKRVGDDRLAFMTESWTLADVTFPFSNRDDYVGVGVGRRTYDAGRGSVFDANVLRLFASTRVGDHAKIDGRVEYPYYSPEQVMKSRPYVDAGIQYTFDSESTLDLRFFTEPLIQNRETLKRDIYRGGARFGFTVKPTRKLDYGFSTLFATYSDAKRNNELDANAFVAYEFNAAPRELKVLFKADYLNFAYQNGIVTPDNPLEGLDVPYFAPQGYMIYSAGADWKHQFGDNWFTGAKDMYYTAGTRLASDSNAVTYFEMKLGGAYDFNDWLGLTVGLRILRSSAIDVTTGNAMLTLRWP